MSALPVCISFSKKKQKADASVSSDLSYIVILDERSSTLEGPDILRE